MCCICPNGPTLFRIVNYWHQPVNVPVAPKDPQYCLNRLRWMAWKKSIKRPLTFFYLVGNGKLILAELFPCLFRNSLFCCHNIDNISTISHGANSRHLVWGLSNQVGRICLWFAQSHTSLIANDTVLCLNIILRW